MRPYLFPFLSFLLAAALAWVCLDYRDARLNWEEEKKEMESLLIEAAGLIFAFSFPIARN